MIHTRDCPTLSKYKKTPEKWGAVEWNLSNNKNKQPARLKIKWKTGPSTMGQIIALLNNQKAQIININLESLDDAYAKSLVKIYSHIIFEFSKGNANRANIPFHLFLEEAHRYIQNDNDVFLLGYNIFERIAKEGRKYGTIIGFITQKPSELSKTALSQCSNFVVFRLFYPEDLGIVKGISSNVTDETIEQIKTLHPGMGLVFGTAFKIPLLAGFPLPNPLPVSTSLNVSNVWYQDVQ